MSTPFNYNHLYYFWVVAKEGGISKAAQKLDMAVQTVSTQVRELEKELGCELLKPAGRGLALTEAGMAAMQQADQIFQLGEGLPNLVRDAARTPGVRFWVGISDGLQINAKETLPVQKMQGVLCITFAGLIDSYSHSI